KGEALGPVYGLVDMPQHAMTDLMAHDPGQFILGIDKAYEPAADKDMPPRNGKGVGFLFIDHIKVIVKAVIVSFHQEASADLVYIRLDKGVIDHTHSPLDLEGQFVSHFLFFLHGHGGEP